MVSRANFPIPDNIHAPLCCLEIQVPDDPGWKSVVAGLLYELQYWFNWERDDANSGKECAAVWKQIYLDIDWNLMACKNNDCCQEPAIIRRINPATGNEEQSTDGGATWRPAPGGWKPLIVVPVPPVTSGVAATKCDAATNVSGQVNAWIDHVSDNFDTAVTLIEFGIGVIVAVAGAVLVVLTGGGLLPAELALIAALSAGIYAAWGAGKAVFDAYWTTEIKDKILCAAFCNIGDDGSFSEAQFSDFWTEVNDELPGSPAKILFMGFLSSVGRSGLCAMAATGMAADADCEDCECSDIVRIYVEPGGGTEVSWDGDTGILIADAEIDGGGNYNVYLAFDPLVLTPGTPARADFCGRCGISLITGAGTGNVFRPCGSLTDTPVGITNPGTSSWNTWVLTSNAPFQIQASGAART